MKNFHKRRSSYIRVCYSWRKQRLWCWFDSTKTPD